MEREGGEGVVVWIGDEGVPDVVGDEDFVEEASDSLGASIAGDGNNFEIVGRLAIESGSGSGFGFLEFWF